MKKWLFIAAPHFEFKMREVILNELQTTTTEDSL